MGRYFRFTEGANSNTFDFTVRADFSERKEYFSEFVFGGERDKRIYGLTRITPTASWEYDVNGLAFLRFVLGSLSGSSVTSVTDTPEMGTIHAGVDGINYGITSSKVDTWNFTVDEGGPVKAEVTAMGKGTTTVAPAAYTTDIDQAVVMPYDVGVTIGTSSIGFVRFNLNINNGLQPVFKNQTVPVTIRPTGLEVSGRIRVLEYYDSDVVDGSLAIKVGTLGVLYVPTVKFTEVPPTATGYELPEIEYSFNGYPTTSQDAVWATLNNTLKW